MRFTVRRQPIGEVSSCCHRPPGGDIACSVHVGVAWSSGAGLALENRLALTVSGCDVPARGAALRRECSRDLLDSTERFVSQTYDQLAPATSTYRAVKPTLLSDSHAWSLDGAARGPGHRPHIECLNPDHVEPPRQVSGRLLHPVLAPICLAGLQLRDRAFRLFAAIGATVAARDPLLQDFQPFRLPGGETGCVQQFASRKRGRYSNSAVNADHTPIARPDNRGGNVREGDMPAARAIAGHPVGLHTHRHRARQAKTHPTDLGHPHPTKAAVQSLHVMRLHRDLPKPFMHTRLAPPRATMRTGEKVPHSLCEIPQRLLLHRLTSTTKPRVLGTRFRQLRALLQIAGSLAARLPMLLLLDCQVPHIARIPAVPQQCFLLLRRRHQAKSRHIRTVTADTDIPGHSAAGPFAIGFRPELMSMASSQSRLQ